LILPLLITIAGILVGLRSNVLVLFMLTLALIATFGIASLWSNESGYTILKFTIVAWISLQGGYVIGLTGRDYVAPLLARLNGAPTKRN
jgi:hypothetical protein